MEVVIAITIIVVIAIFAIRPFINFRHNQSLEIAVTGTLSLLDEARGATLSSRDDEVYGVHFESGRAVLFKGGVFTEPSSDNRGITFDERVTLSNIDLDGGDDDVLFSRLTGETNDTGTLTFSLINNASTTRIINISKTGVSSRNE